MKMKTSAGLLILCLNGCFSGLLAQNDSVSGQHDLMQKLMGIWYTKSGDTMEIWDGQPYGNGFIIEVYRIIHGDKKPFLINNLHLDTKENNFKGYVLWNQGFYNTWMGSFVSENYFKVKFVRNFNPDIIFGSFEIILTDEKTRKHLHYDQNGILTREETFMKQ